MKLTLGIGFLGMTLLAAVLLTLRARAVMLASRLAQIEEEVLADSEEDSP